MGFARGLCLLSNFVSRDGVFRGFWERAGVRIVESVPSAATAESISGSKLHGSEDAHADKATCKFYLILHELVFLNAEGVGRFLEQWVEEKGRELFRKLEGPTEETSPGGENAVRLVPPAVLMFFTAVEQEPIRNSADNDDVPEIVRIFTERMRIDPEQEHRSFRPRTEPFLPHAANAFAGGGGARLLLEIIWDGVDTTCSAKEEEANTNGFVKCPAKNPTDSTRYTVEAHMPLEAAGSPLFKSLQPHQLDNLRANTHRQAPIEHPDPAVVSIHTPIPPPPRTVYWHENEAYNVTFLESQQLIYDEDDCCSNPPHKALVVGPLSGPAQVSLLESR